MELSLPAGLQPQLIATVDQHAKSTIFMILLLLLFEMEFCFCCSGWSAMAQSRLTATSASWVQVILLPQPPKKLGLQAPATMPGQFFGRFHHIDQVGLKLLTSGDPSTSATQIPGITDVNRCTRPSTTFQKDLGYHTCGFAKSDNQLSQQRVLSEADGSLGDPGIQNFSTWPKAGDLRVVLSPPHTLGAGPLESLKEELSASGDFGWKIQLHRQGSFLKPVLFADLLSGGTCLHTLPEPACCQPGAKLYVTSLSASWALSLQWLLGCSSRKTPGDTQLPLFFPEGTLTQTMIRKTQNRHRKAEKADETSTTYTNKHVASSMWQTR
ncbi:hypothetical protein AAY473_008982 [Plecturocebus cupreus]